MPIKKTDLEKLARQLRLALEIIEAELAPVDVSPAVQAMMDDKLRKRICLAWDHVIPDGEPIYRGLCETDYNTTTARIRRGEELESDLMRRGELGPKAKPGRKAARDIAASHKAAEAEMERQRNLKALKAAEKKAEYKKPKGSSNE
jgi:hypothetical protein